MRSAERSPTWHFSPLFIGEITSTREKWPPSRAAVFSSVPSSSGKSLQRRLLHTLTCQVEDFSPLFIGEITSTPRFFSARSRFQLFQSPLHRGNHFNDIYSIRRQLKIIISVPSSSGKSLQRHEPSRT